MIKEMVGWSIGISFFIAMMSGTKRNELADINGVPVSRTSLATS